MDKNYKSDLVIVYTIDDAFIDLVSVSIESVVQNNPKKSILFYLCTDRNECTYNFNILKRYYEQNKNIKITFLNTRMYDEYFEQHNLDRWGSSSYYVYWRLVVFELLNVDKAIYLDADTLCLKEIVFPDIGNKSVGCVLDCVHPHYHDVLGISRQQNLYNTGTMFVDVYKWKKNNNTKKILNYLNTKDKFLMADQDIFSLALKDDIYTIGPEYNYFAGYDYYGIKNSFFINGLNKKNFYGIDALEEASKKVVIYHCLDGVFKRPWVKDSTSPIKNSFLKYMEDSAFKDITKQKELSGIFILEKKAELLPDILYNAIHYCALWISFELKRKDLK